MLYRKAIVEQAEDGLGLLVMDGEGNVRAFQTPKQVLVWIRRIDGAAARLGHNTTTTIEWRNMPEGFELPQ
jgi:hypothetical protein